MPGNTLGFLDQLGLKVDDVDEETFSLFFRASALTGLGMVNPRAQELDITIGNKDYMVMQSPGALLSKGSKGTTGAVLWRTSLAFAQSISDPRCELRGEANVFNSQTTVLELGSGTSGLLARVLAPFVKTVIATDQFHTLKQLRANVEGYDSIKVMPLDWEETDIGLQLRSHGLGQGIDVVIACDCIYNEALIAPFVQTCTDICRLRPAICIIAQHLRQEDIFAAWLLRFSRFFHTWRMPEGFLGHGDLVVHIGTLK
ncbi:hypothetical protein K470DRAFT_208434 [Piedraia hortae CBS 480.64]|uniref:Uncharacterized protein n=1 Tax=Piedraia hortae CBS 480.64 TaxID=1314780 RepID=A0A6A7CA07_9PEZI|nr:hypothetical protein K470DRAFT_208434 [Piedraia hortae CBS 480.64]